MPKSSVAERRASNFGLHFFKGLLPSTKIVYVFVGKFVSWSESIFHTKAKPNYTIRVCPVRECKSLRKYVSSNALHV